MFKASIPECTTINKCSRRTKTGMCKGACKSTTNCAPKVKCDCKAYKNGCPCQPAEQCKQQCKKCAPIECQNCLTQPGCPSKNCPQKCKCQFVQVCGCSDPSKVCKKRCGKEGQYPTCEVKVPGPQELVRKKACKHSIDVFISRIGMGDVTMNLTPIPDKAFQLKPLTLREQSSCVATPKPMPCGCPNTKGKCCDFKCGIVNNPCKK